jgi:hypothetical protein
MNTKVMIALLGSAQAAQLVTKTTSSVAKRQVDDDMLAQLEDFDLDLAEEEEYDDAFAQEEGMELEDMPDDEDNILAQNAEEAA